MKQGWEIKKLGEVCEEITDGSHFSPKSYDEGEYPYITVRDIDEDIIDFKNCKFIKRNDYLNLLKNGCKPNEGDLLFSKDGTVGKVALVNFEKEFVVLSSLAIIRPKSEIIYSPFLKYILKDPAFLNEAIGRKTGVAIKRIILRNLKEIEIAYPKTLPEQQRIVSILDEAFAAIAKAKANAEQNLKNAKELFESYLQGVFEKKGDEWEEKTLGEVYDVRDGTHDSPKYHNQGYPLVTSKNLKNHKLTFDDIKFISETDYLNINKRSKVDVGDVLFAMIGTIGNPVVIEDEPNYAIKNVALFKVGNNQNSYFLKYFLDSKQTIEKMMRDAKGTTQKFVGLGYLRSFPILVPPLKDQQTIVRQLDALRAETQKLEAVYQKKIDDLEELKKSILRKAFAGELKTANRSALYSVHSEEIFDIAAEPQVSYSKK